MSLRARSGWAEALITWGPPAAFALLISAVSHQSVLVPPEGSPDWLLHGLEFAVLAGLVARGFWRQTGRLVAGYALCALAACVGFALLDEWHQSFIPGRISSLADVGADGAGAALALAAALFIAFRRPAKEPEVVLLGREGCHLCDEAESVIRSILPETGGRFVKRDIDRDPELKRRYDQDVPVVLLDGIKRFKYRVDPARFRRAMSSRTRRGAGR